LKVNYIAAGPVDAQPILLIHGFGASGFHWRRNVNVLAAAGYRVYAIDLIGFGLSSKPVIDYDSRLWREQCAAFLREVAGCGEGGKRAIVAGNSIGGYTALMVGAEYPELTLGVASLNGAGRFSPSPEEAETFEWNRQWALREMKNPLNRHGGDRFVVSATNFGKMRYDKLLGLTGANVAMIVKLFSAVDWWGPGEDGWQKWDNTWLCTDKKDAFGRIIVEQGRILWRLGAESKRRRSSFVESAQHRTKALTTSLSIRWLAICCFVVYFVAYHLRLSIASLPDLR
jgi:pimeloyl-ACP methyl ester carboxylesterase